MTHPLRAAFLPGDVAAVTAQLHPDVELCGPVLRAPIHGRAAVSRVFAALRAELRDMVLEHEVGDARATVLVLRGASAVLLALLAGIERSSVRFSARVSAGAERR